MGTSARQLRALRGCIDAKAAYERQAACRTIGKSAAVRSAWLARAGLAAAAAASFRQPGLAVHPLQELGAVAKVRDLT
jgi:hypothetical protein